MDGSRGVAGFGLEMAWIGGATAPNFWVLPALGACERWAAAGDFANCDCGSLAGGTVGLVGEGTSARSAGAVGSRVPGAGTAGTCTAAAWSVLAAGGAPWWPSDLVSHPATSTAAMSMIPMAGPSTALAAYCAFRLAGGFFGQGFCAG